MSAHVNHGSIINAMLRKIKKKFGALLHITQGTFFESEDVLTRLLMTKIHWSDVG